MSTNSKMQSLLEKLNELVTNSRKSNIIELERGYEISITKNGNYLVHNELLDETLDVFFKYTNKLKRAYQKMRLEKG